MQELVEPQDNKKTTHVMPSVERGRDFACAEVGNKVQDCVACNELCRELSLAKQQDGRGRENDRISQDMDNQRVETAALACRHPACLKGKVTDPVSE